MGSSVQSPTGAIDADGPCLDAVVTGIMHDLLCAGAYPRKERTLKGDIVGD
jgi:hypothetical protein